MVSINELISQYDQLKLKRSNLTQRDEQPSAQQASDFDSGSDTKLGRAVASTLLMSKCVPKSKINLTDVVKGFAEGSSCFSSISKDRTKMTYHEARSKYFKDRKSNNNNSQSTLKIEDTNDCSCTLPVAPTGLNLTLAHKGRLGVEPSLKEEGLRVHMRLLNESQKSSKYRLMQKKVLRLSADKREQVQEVHAMRVWGSI
jgi:hypothetical protein